jgi:excisionase family DNA binding protein
MSLGEAAALLGVDPGTLRVQVHNGKLKARKVGPIWTVTPKEIERYARENRR